MATILIVEDELLIAEEVAYTVRKLGHTPLVPVSSSDEALAVLGKQSIQLVLMDINIGGDCDGIASALLIRRQYAIPVVFLTARSDETTFERAKLARPYGYIIKPFTENGFRVQLELALHNAYNLPENRPALLLAEAEVLTAPLTQPSNSAYFFVRNSAGKGGNHIKIKVSDILYFEANANYVHLVTATRKFIFDGTIKEMEQRLPSCFIKTHRSYLVNLDHIDVFEESGVLVGQDFVPVSRSCREELKSRIQMLG